MTSSERTYLKTHPWIQFQLDTNKLNYRIWILLGEAQSKCEHIKGAPLLPDTIKQMYHVYLAKGALATTAIEGNTLTEAEVEKRIKGELKLPPSREYLGQEIDNVVNAYNMIATRLIKENGSDRLSVEEIEEYNRWLLKDLKLDEGIESGKLRNYPVGVADYRGAPPEDCEYLLTEYIHWLNDNFRYPEDQKVVFGILKAIVAHLYFVWIHPFGDGNGRTARLIEFQILLSVGVPAVAAHLLSNHYNITRTEYYRQLRETSKSGGEITEFIEYALQGFVDGLKNEIESIQEQQMHVHWINHIHNSFGGKESITEKRQRKLILEISNHLPETFTFTDVRHASSIIAEIYAEKTDITLKRDLIELVKMDFLVNKKDNYSLNLQQLQVYKTPVRK